ncbi:MAG: hypothetical protein WDZ27_07510 [Waddliaceae bacterium]
MILILFLVFLSSCQFQEKGKKELYSSIDSFVARLSETHYVHLTAVERSGDENFFRSVGFMLQMCGPINKDRGRYLVTDFTEKFVDHLNSDQKFMKYWESPTVKLQNVSVGIIIKNNGEDIDKFFPSTIFCSNGKVRYFTYDQAKLVYDEEETYEEAVEKVQEYLKTHDLQAELSR